VTILLLIFFLDLFRQLIDRHRIVAAVVVARDDIEVVRPVPKLIKTVALQFDEMHLSVVVEMPFGRDIFE